MSAYPHRAFVLAIVSLCLVCPLGCSSSSGGGGGGGPTVVPGSGGSVGASCPLNADGIACSVDLSAKVRCKDGKWLDDGVCGAGLKCLETKNATGAIIATACIAPPVSNPGLAAACAKYDQCYQEGGAGGCMRDLALAPTMISLWGKLGWVPEIDDMSVLQLPAAQACVLAAKDCAALSACFTAKVPAFTCGNGKAFGCSGSVAYFCENGNPLALDCALFGLPCHKLADVTVMCTHDPGCKAGAQENTCVGTKAHICKELKDGAGTVGWTMDCAAIGMTCRPEVQDDDPDVCGQVGAKACGDGFVDRCEGNILVECNKGKEVRLDCAFVGRTCTMEKVGDDTYARCSVSSDCPEGEYGAAGPPTCEGNRLSFCDGTGWVSLDCTQYGMTCKEGSYGESGCVF